MWLQWLVSQLRHSLVVHPLLKKILDPPLILLEILGRGVPPGTPTVEPDQNAIFDNHFNLDQVSVSTKRVVHVYIGQEQGVKHVIIIIA